DGTPAVESASMPGMPPQVICYERADDIAFGVSGIVTRGRGIRTTFPDLNPAEIPMAVPVKQEKVMYLLDPTGASRRSAGVRAIDSLLRSFRFALPLEHDAIELPYTPEFLSKHDGLVMSIGQFNQWVGSQVMASGAVQVWPGTPVAKALIEDRRVTGVRLVDQGVDKDGHPEAGFLPGMDIRAALTVVADGPVGVVSRQIDNEIGVPKGYERKDWAVGCKFVIDLPESCDLEPGTVYHTLGFPEPEIFGFFYVHPDRIASAGIFVPSWFTSPVRTSYRYLQHFLRHPFFWRQVQGGRLRSWGAKSLQESGRRGEPFLAGDGYARIGEGSGSTNVLTGSGVDEAWTTGSQLAESVLELLKQGKPFTRENLESTYVLRRRRSWGENEGRIAEKARDGFQRGFLTGLVGMALSGFTKGLINMPGSAEEPYEKIPTPYEFYRGRIDDHEIAKIREECTARCVPLHDALMERAGWPAIEYDGQLLVSHQDALLMGGKVQAPAGYADHVVFLDPTLCKSCGSQVCVEICSAEAIAPGPEGAPVFDREKCVHCGACLWNCTRALADDSGRTNLEFRAGAGGFHSVEN
ncbi:MAG: 4Fe-4S ferredoxin, partial [Acidobacteria bacterium]|nr:4Fe-4S ferredoxin [Acidobacteriota bacterium]